MLSQVGQIVGGIIGAAGSLFGGKKSAKATEDAAMMNYLAQKEFAQHGIRWKVEDAKAAGLHPLYALGGSGASFSPSFTVSGEGAGIADAGQHLGRAAAAALQPSERALQDAQLRALSAQADRDEAAAALSRSRAAREEQERNASKPIGIGSMEEVFPVYEHQGRTGVVEVGPIGPSSVNPIYKPPEVTTHRPADEGTVTGKQPGFVERSLGNDVAIMWPAIGDKPKDELDIADYAPMIAKNIKEYGLDGFLGRYFILKKRGLLGSMNDALVLSIAKGIAALRR